jgi:tetratricopeptide (TPR) repeat protein
MKTRRIFFISLVLMATASLHMRVVAQDVSAGKKLIETLQWNKANQLFIDLVKKTPTDPSLKFYLGETFFALGKPDSAESNYSKSTDFAFSYAGLGKIILTKGDTTKAKESFNKAIKGDKKNGDLFAYIVDVCVSANYPKLAEQYFLRGKEVTTKNARLYVASGNLAKLKGNAGDAANAYENANYYDKNLALAYVKVGMIYSDSRTWDLAEKKFKEALAVDPQYSLAFKGLGDMYYKSGRFQEASDNYKKYLETSEVTLDDNYRYAFILFYNKQYAEATKMVKDLLVTDSKNPVLLRIQAYISYELGVDDKKTVTDKESIKTALTNINNFFNEQSANKLLSSDYEYLAKIQIASGLDSLAPANYIKAFEKDSSRINFVDEAAKLNTKLGKYLQAVECYKTLIKVSPENSLINTYKMGTQYYFQATKKDTAKADSLVKRQNLVFADSAFKQVATQSPNSTLGPLWMARTEQQLDTKGEGLAKPVYEKLIEMILAANETVKRKNELMEAYRYLGSHWYEKAYIELAKKKDKAAYTENKTKSLEYWNKILELNPNDTQAPEAIKEFANLDKIKNKPAPQPQQ